MPTREEGRQESKEAEEKRQEDKGFGAKVLAWQLSECGCCR